MLLMEVDLQISINRPCSMLEKVLMTLVEVDLGLGPAVLRPVIQVIAVYHIFSLVLVIIKLDIRFLPANFLHITMVD